MTLDELKESAHLLGVRMEDLSAAVGVLQQMHEELIAGLYDHTPPVEPPVEPPVDPPVDPPVEPPVEPPPTGFVCSNPRMGRVRTLWEKNDDVKQLFMVKSTSDSCMRAFSAIEHLATRIVYSPPSVHHLAGGDKLYDHSAAGIEKHAKRIWDFWLSSGGKVLWWDPEMGSSINVPASVGYNPKTEREYAAHYWPWLRKELRLEAVRFQSAVAAKVIARAKAAGKTDFEMGIYNAPRLPREDLQNDASLYTTAAAETNKQWLCPNFAFGGPSAYFSGDSEAMKKGPDAFVEWRKNMVRRYRKAFGPKHRIVPAIWARWFDPGGDGPYPGGTWVVPAGHMRKMAEGLLEAGVDGFVIWRSSLDDKDSAAFSKRYEEVVEVIKADGRFERA